MRLSQYQKQKQNRLFNWFPNFRSWKTYGRRCKPKKKSKRKAKQGFCSWRQTDPQSPENVCIHFFGIWFSVFPLWAEKSIYLNTQILLQHDSISTFTTNSIVNFNFMASIIRTNMLICLRACVCMWLVSACVCVHWRSSLINLCRAMRPNGTRIRSKKTTN